MVMWSLVAAGNADADAADDLRRSLTDLLTDPRYGTSINMLHVGRRADGDLDETRDTAACA